MKEPRRQFLLSAAAVFSGAIWGVRLGAYPQRRGMPSPPEAADPRQNAPENANGRPSLRAVVQQHEKEFRDSLASLSERVSQLKEEVEQLRSADIFSVKIYKETSEIERLAKQLKTLAKS
jgi:hypothetical protein